jgi:hypothetical protein
MTSTSDVDVEKRVRESRWREAEADGWKILAEIQEAERLQALRRIEWKKQHQLERLIFWAGMACIIIAVLWYWGL